MEYNYFTYRVQVQCDKDSSWLYGVTTGYDYSDAVANVCETYSNKKIIQLIVEDFDNSACLEMTKEALEDFKRAVNF